MHAGPGDGKSIPGGDMDTDRNGDTGDARPRSEEQDALWNGAAGAGWAASQELLDRLFRPFEDLLLDAVPPENSGACVLDVGCGTGATTHVSVSVGVHVASWN